MGEKITQFSLTYFAIFNGILEQFENTTYHFNINKMHWWKKYIITLHTEIEQSTMLYELIKKKSKFEIRFEVCTRVWNIIKR